MASGDVFAANISYTAVITIISSSGYTLSGVAANPVAGAVSSVTSQSGSGAVINAVFPVLADDPGSLGTAIAAAKASANPVVQLTSGFYSTANSGGSYIAVDAGTTDNPTPYTIKGTGKASSDVLAVGILLANDNVTLEQVKINIPAAASGIAAPSSWETYNAGISIGRAGSGGTLLTLGNLTSSNVTVKDTDVTITGAAGFTAGIYVCGVAASSNNVYASTNITLSGNTVHATGYSSNAVQALAIGIWHPSIVITGNTFEARYGTRGSKGYYGGRPASAIYISRVYGADKIGTGTPTISGNTLISSVYSFYFNALQVTDVTDKAGVAVLRDDNFSVAETTWALPNSGDTSSTYKLVFNALKTNISDKGFGFVGIPVFWSPDVLFNIEQYEIEAGTVEAVSVYGSHIVNDSYDGDSLVNKFDTGTTGDDYGRKLVTAPADYTNAANNKFCYGLNEAGTGYEYDTDLIP
jgi:hypothetical protein